MILSSLLPFPLQCDPAGLLIGNWNLFPNPLSLSISGDLVLWSMYPKRLCYFHTHPLETPAAQGETLG